MAAMVLRSTPSDAPPQPEIQGATTDREIIRRKVVQRSLGVGRGARGGRGLRGGTEALRHAIRINAPKTGNSKTGKMGQAKWGRQMRQKKGFRGERGPGDSNQRLSKLPIECKPKCG